MRYVPIFNGGIFWRTEVQVGRSDRVAVASRLGADQWVQKEREEGLVALSDVLDHGRYEWEFNAGGFRCSRRTQGREVVNEKRAETMGRRRRTK